MTMQYKTRCVVLKTRRKQLQMFLALIDKSPGLDAEWQNSRQRVLVRFSLLQRCRHGRLDLHAAQLMFHSVTVAARGCVAAGC